MRVYVCVDLCITLISLFNYNNYNYNSFSECRLFTCCLRDDVIYYILYYRITIYCYLY